jgi:signal transduction histidine kinase
MPIFVHIVDAFHEVVYSDLPDEYIYDAVKCKKEFEYGLGKSGKRKRQGKISTKRGWIYLCTPGEQIQNSDFNKLLNKYKDNSEIIFGLFQNIRCNEKEKTDSLKHNIVTSTAHLSQDLYRLIPEELLMTRGATNQIEAISQIIGNNPTKTAETILEVLKRLRFIKTEIDIYDMLYERTGHRIDQKHNLHRVLYLSLYHFLRDLNSKNIEVSVADSELNGHCDYKAISVIFNNLFSNAEKYAIPNHDINIRFEKDNDRVNIIIDMIGLKVEPEEEEQIFNPGYSGKWAYKSQKAGTGMGLNIIKRICEMTDVKVEFKCYKDTKDHYYNDLPYQSCSFIISVPYSE